MTLSWARSFPGAADWAEKGARVRVGAGAGACAGAGAGGEVAMGIEAMAGKEKRS